MSNDSHAALALALGAGTGLGLWYLLRDDEPKEKDTKEDAPPAPAPPPCALRLDAKGLTADGAAVDVPTAIATCKAAGRADLVLADDAPSAAYADVSAAFGAAGILIQQRRNARGKRAPLPWVRVGDRVRLAEHVRPFPAYGNKPAITRATVLEVERVLGRGTKRDPYRVILTDGTHEWYVEPEDVVIVEHGFGRRQARPPRYLAWCGTCYSGARLETNSRRKANEHATSHLTLYPGHDVHVTDLQKQRARDERNVRGRNDRSDRELTTLVALVERLDAASAARQGAEPPDPAVKLARFIAKHSGARVDEASLDYQDNVVVTGAPAEMRKVAAWVARLARDSGRDIAATVETFEDPEDSDWAICRIRGLIKS